jgi:hypothetical protein
MAFRHFKRCRRWKGESAIRGKVKVQWVGGSKRALSRVSALAEAMLASLVGVKFEL